MHRASASRLIKYRRFMRGGNDKPCHHVPPNKRTRYQQLELIHLDWSADATGEALSLQTNNTEENAKLGAPRRAAVANGRNQIVNQSSSSSSCIGNSAFLFRCDEKRKRNGRLNLSPLHIDVVVRRCVRIALQWAACPKISYNFQGHNIDFNVLLNEPIEKQF